MAILLGAFVFVHLINPYNPSFDPSLFLVGHTVIETISVIIATQIFSVVLSSRREGLPASIVIVAIMSLGMAVLDFGHMMSYAGMPDFITASDPEKAINFWLSARLIGAVSLLVIAIMPWRINFNNKYFAYGVASILLFSALMYWLFLFRYDSLPRTFIEGYGLTKFKQICEYILSFMYLMSCVLLFLKMLKPREFNASYFLMAAFSLALAELFFSVYSDVTDLYNLSGHVYKLIGFVFLYKAAYREMVQRPYQLLAQSTNQLQATLNALPDLLFELDSDGRYLKVQSTDPSELSNKEEHLIGKTANELLPKSQSKILMSSLSEAKAKGISRNKTLELHTVSGAIQNFELSVSYVPAIGDMPERYIMISHNITQRILEAKELHKLSQAVWQNPLSIYILNEDFQITYINKAFSELTGYNLQEVIGKDTGSMFSNKNPDSLQHEIKKQLKSNKSWLGEIICSKKTGEDYIVSSFIYPTTDPQGNVTGYLCTERDITETKDIEQKLQKITNFDPLTGLPNRKQLQKLLDYLIQHHDTLAVLWVDLDHFRNINDVMGHSIGDVILKEVAERILSIIRPQDILSRLSGDDFIVVLPSADESMAVNNAQNIIDLIKQPFYIAEQLTSCASSIGIAFYPEDGLDSTVLLQNAETTMHRVKESVRGSYQFFKKEMHSDTSRRLSLDIGLKQAIINKELFLEYQPQVSLETGKVIGAEALLRWQTSNWELVSPLEFVPIAESNGTIIQIGEWVIHNALNMLMRIIKDGDDNFVMAVNISALQFEHPNFINTIKNALKETGAPAHCLELEITEAVAMKNPELVAHKIQQLHRANINIAIDDFGTGYSSLSYLKRFKVNTIKIDRTFIKDIDNSKEEKYIADAIVYIAKILGVETIAEGVETKLQLDYMRRLGCNAVQGYYFSKPLPARMLLEFIHKNTNDTHN